jgi:hypothetical protein
MNHNTVFAGLDVHKDSITAACIGIHPSEPPVDLGTVGTQQYAVDPARETFRPRDLAVCLRGWPHAASGWCATFDPRASAASSPRRRAARRTHQDRSSRRAQSRTRTARWHTQRVHVPTADQEAFRDVVRAWQQSKT